MSRLLREDLAGYLALRRSLGYRLDRPEKLLGQFLDHLEQAGTDVVTVGAALDWSRLPANADSNWHAYRLSVVRGLATYLHALDPVHHVPAADLLPQRLHRASPYLYSDAEIAAPTSQQACHDRTRSDPTSVLHRPPHRAAARQLTHRGRLPDILRLLLGYASAQSGARRRRWTCPLSMHR